MRRLIFLLLICVAALQVNAQTLGPAQLAPALDKSKALTMYRVLRALVACYVQLKLAYQCQEDYWGH